MLVSRCAHRVTWLVQRRQINLRSKASSVWESIKGYLTQSEKGNFDEDFVRKAYKADKLSEKEWLLIYRDQGASRSFFLVSIIYPIVSIALVFIAYDIYRNDQHKRFKAVQRLVRDVEEVGLLAVFPATAIVFVVLMMFRIHQLRILRIYQNRTSADTYLAVGSKKLIQKDKIHFSRDSASACYFAEQQKDLSRLLAHIFIGNMQVEKRRFIISDDLFRGNNYRTYMLNETSIPPRLQ